MSEELYHGETDVVNSVTFLPFGTINSDGYVTFDRLRLSIPMGCVSIEAADKFTSTVSGDGEIMTLAYEQKVPYYYSIRIDHLRKTAYLEFNGKSLGDHYPELINAQNIATCIENINEKKVCYIEPAMAIQEATVLQCDVTRDIQTEYRITDIYKGLMMRNNRQWSLRDITATRFAIENTAVTKRKKARLTLYDKEIDMNRNENSAFLESVSNREYQLDYFRNKIRYELKLNSFDRIRHFFGIKKSGPIQLTTLLLSSADPIEVLLSQAIVSNDPIEIATNNCKTIRELEHFLLMTFLNYDMELLEKVIRELSSNSRSIKRAMAPYLKIREQLCQNNIDPSKNLTLIDIRNFLRYIISITMAGGVDNCNRPINILQIYNHDKHSKSANEEDI